MKKKLLPLAVLLSIAIEAQVGINTTTPQATLDVTGTPGVTTSLDGIIAPRLTGDELRAKTYTGAQTGALVYVTNADSAPQGQTKNVTSTGYFYFDGNQWVASNGTSGKTASWSLYGNSNTTAGINFLGTTDNTDLLFKRNNSQAGLLSIANTAFGVNSFNSTATGGSNTSIGSFSLFSNTSGSSNTSVGESSLRANTQGINNTASGVQALQSNTTGSNNTANGLQTLQSNTIGMSNTANGYQTMQSNVSGNFNNASGYQALQGNNSGNNNTASGYQSLQSNSTGSNNSGIGSQALFSNTTGSRNTAVGNLAGGNLTTGNNNIAIGNSTDFVSANASNQMNIGNMIFGTGLSGSIAAPEGYIGIGNSSPASTLHVSGSFGASITTKSSGTLDATHNTVIVTGGIGLPVASDSKGRIYHIYLGTSSGITITGNISYLGNTSSSWVLDNTVGNRGITLQSDGTNWVVIGRAN
ncbi:beta strand repeat-containing protein [Chryseobacterium aureum]|uniref:beta strand repeat-containing protein n=1 Tax=Chryseobacterium aureum TaxID=2497456 RepID=UPI000F8695EE|nr:hypothetical protein [Chryseobacterium aureum]